MSVIKAIVARLASTKVLASTETEAGFGVGEVRFSALKPWKEACDKLGFKIKKEPTKMVIHYTACDPQGNAVGIFNEDVELVGFGFGRLNGKYFDKHGRVLGE